MLRSDEAMVPREDVVDEFPDGVPAWTYLLPVEDLRRVMEDRREGYTRLGFDPAEDAPDDWSLH